MSTTTNETRTLGVMTPATPLGWGSNLPPSSESGVDYDVPPVLVRYDGSTIPWYVEVRTTNGGTDTMWFSAERVVRLDTWPEPPVNAHMLSLVAENLRWWAEQSDTPVASGVDAQAAELRRAASMEDTSAWPNPHFHAWPETTWTTTREGKAYLGNVMRYAQWCRDNRVDVVALRNTEQESTERIAALQAELERQVARTREAEQRHQQDIDRIGSTLMNEAVDRDWCGEYDTVITRLNRSLHIPLPEREQDYDGSWTETYTITVRRICSVTAIDDDGAADAVEAYADGEDDLSDDITRALEGRGYEVTNATYASSDNYTAERA